MYVTKLKWAMATVLALTLLGSGAGVATYGALGQPPGAEQKEPERSKVAAAAPKVAERVDEAKAPGPHTAAAVRKRLQEPIVLDRAIDNVPLKDVLEFLSDTYKVSIRIDPAAFVRLGIPKPYEIEDQQIRLQLGRNLTLAGVLREALAQVQATGPAGPRPITFQVKGSHVAIIPAYVIPLARTIATGGDQPLLNPDIVEEQVQGDPVSVDVREKPLVDVLQELADATGANIVLDSRCRDQGGSPVTLSLQNVRLFTALRVIADMADLQPVAVGNVYYVTTKDNAERLHRQEWLKEDANQPAPPSAKPQSPKPAGK